MPKGNVEDFYPLSPIQQGMLIHALDAPEADVYCGQLLCQLSGALDVAAFENAWQQVIKRHAILRTRFVWEGLKEPVQVVQRQVAVPLEVHDWRDLPPEARTYQLEQLRQGDRARGFTLSQAPLMRLTLVRVAEQDYQFLWSYHHLLLDGWSMTVLFQDVATVYQAYVKGKSLELPPPRPYRDYLVWLQQQDLAAAERFWRRQLQGFTAPTEFRIDERSSDMSAQPHRGKQQVKFSPQLTNNLQRFAQQHQITLNTLIQGAWAILLSRYSGATDVVFGTTSSGRPPELAGVESMLGVFINTLPLRVQVQPDLPLELWLQQIQRQQVEIRQYEYSPLAQVQQWSDVTPGLPLFESLVLFQNYPVDETLGSDLGDLAIGSLQTFEQTHYPLTLIVGLGETLELRLLYDRQRFTDEAIARLAGHFQTVLDSMGRSADQRLAAVAWLTEAERQQLLAWSQPRGNYACNHTLHQRFEAQAAQTPDAIAVVHGAQSFTYRSLNQRANQLAHALQQRGIQPDRLVGLCVERSLDLLVGILGILKAGGAYVPLDPAAPPERLAFMIADSQLEVVVTEAHLIHALTTGQDGPGQAGVQLLCLDADWEAIAQFPSTNPISPTSPNHPAYVIYTSGSTGLPKGVLVTHGNVTRLFDATDEWFQFCDRDRWALFHSFAFDFSVWEIWGALLYGGRLLIVPYCLSRDPQAFHQWVCQEGVTVLNQTPSAFWQFMQADAASAHTATLPLRYVIFGGEALDLASLKPWCDRHGDGQGLAQGGQRSPRLINMYGITETTVHVTYRPITQADVAAAAGSLIGRAIPDLQLYVLDPQRQLVPIGVPGELYVGGAGVAQGYVNRPDLTTERFIPNPFGAGRLYRTGDRVRYCPSGELAYLGRLDHQVKLRGFRIELGEIEAVLRQHSALREASVLVREDRPGDQRLVAYVVPREPHDNLATVLKTCLRAQLPDYMVPSAFVMLEALPLTLNGKLDRSALPAPPPIALPLADRLVPQTSVEKALVEIWSTVLGLEAIGIDDNFFDIGGHSLLAAQVVTRIRDQFQVKLSMRDLFEAPTIAALATVVESRRRSRTGLALPPIPPLPRTGQSFPVSFAQRRLWVLDQLDPGRAFYTIPAAVRLRGWLDLAALGTSFQQLVQRHETLRTTFAQVEGQPVQVIAPALDLPLAIIDLRDCLGHSDREAQAAALCLSEVQCPFDLEQGPLLRVTVLKLAETEHIVLLTMHHIVSDGWSMGVLIQELASLYSACVHHQVPTLPALTVQYADFAAWQQQQADDWLPHQLTYWLRQLQGAPSFLPLPTDYPRPAVQRFCGAQQPFELTANLSQALHELGRQESATLFMTLLAGFNVLLHHLTQAEDILVGSPIANRNRAELEGLIGFFVNTLVLRSQPSGGISFRTLLHQVRETTLAAYAHPDAPFERLVDELKLKRTLSHNPLFQVWFVLQNAPAPDLELPGLTLSAVDVEQSTARYDLKLNLWESAAGIAGFWNYNTDLFAATTIHCWSETWVALLERLTQSPDLPLQDVLAQLAERDRQQQQAQVQGLQSTGRQRLKQTRRKPLRG